MREKVQRMLYLMAAGYPDDAASIARVVATEALDLMGRRKCEWTGNDYFYEYEP